MLIDKIKSIQDDLGVSNCELSRLSGINKSTIGRVMSKKTDPALSTLILIANSLNLDISVIQIKT